MVGGKAAFLQKFSDFSVRFTLATQFPNGGGVGFQSLLFGLCFSSCEHLVRIHDYRIHELQQLATHNAECIFYWGGEPPQELTVGFLTSLAGSLAVGYAQNLLTSSAHLPHQRYQFDVGWEKPGVAPVTGARRPECSCGKTIGHSDQARADRSVSRPPHWPKPEFIEVREPLLDK